jgi:hypothetical protein
MPKVQLSPEQKEFAKVKRFIQKRFPGARTEARIMDGVVYYQVVDGEGHVVIDPELLLPPATTIRQAWADAKYCAWFTNMIRKSNNAFNQEKMIKKINKELGYE